MSLRSDRNRFYVIKEVTVGHMSPQERERAQQEAELLSEVSLGGGLSMLTMLLGSGPHQ